MNLRKKSIYQWKKNSNAREIKNIWIQLSQEHYDYKRKAMNFWTNVGLTGGMYRAFFVAAMSIHFIIYYPIDLINIAEEFVNQTKELKHIKFEFNPR